MPGSIVAIALMEKSRTLTESGIKELIVWTNCLFMLKLRSWGNRAISGGTIVNKFVVRMMFVTGLIPGCRNDSKITLAFSSFIPRFRQSIKIVSSPWSPQLQGENSSADGHTISAVVKEADAQTNSKQITKLSTS